MSKPRDCLHLSCPPQEDIRWNFETAADASCKMASKGAFQHWEVTIPNDKIFDETRIRDRGAHTCGSAVFDGMDGTRCSAGTFGCSLDNVSPS